MIPFPSLHAVDLEAVFDDLLLMDGSLLLSFLLHPLIDLSGDIGGGIKAEEDGSIQSLFNCIVYDDIP